MIVCDASIVVKLYVPEEGTEEVRALTAEEWCAPDFVFVEIGSVLWKKVRRGQVTAEQAGLALTESTKVITRCFATHALAAPALDIALALSHPIYDALYLALARNLGVPLVTADRRLVAACAGTPFESLVRPLVAPPPASPPPPPARKRRQR